MTSSLELELYVQSLVGPGVHPAIEAFEAWAERTGRSIEGQFRRVDAAGIDGSDYGGIEFPLVAMAEYESGSLTFLSPSRAETATVTVQDRLDRLESRSRDTHTEQADGCQSHR